MFGVKSEAKVLSGIDSVDVIMSEVEFMSRAIFNVASGDKIVSGSSEVERVLRGNSDVK